MKREKSASTQSKQLFPIRRSQSSQRPSILQNHDRQNIPPLVLTLGLRDGLQSKRSLVRLSDRNKYDVQYRLPQETPHLVKGFWPSCSENAFELNGSKGGSRSKKTTTFIPPEYMTLTNEPSLLPKFLREKLKLKSRNTTRNFFGQGALVLSPITIKKEDDMSLMDSKPNFAFSLNTNKNEAVYRASGDHQKQISTPLQSQSPEPMRCQGQHYDISPLSKPNLTTRTSISPHLHTNLTSQNKSKKDNTGMEDQLLKNFNSHRTSNEDQTINSVLTYKKNSESSFSANILGSIKLKRTPSHVSYKTIDLRSVGVEAEKNQDLSPSKRCKESIEFRRKRWTSMLRVRNSEFARTYGQTSSPYESEQATSKKAEKLIS